ncbi:proline:sodium symporter PutP, partial [Candidatus Endoriftia persephone str. Guaymas]|nr:proline:sodium symporter PutP [Candidatus Endoriftia persephone str. Guaymas]
FGGFIAVSWTDLLQGLLMLAALLAVPLIALGELGGVAEALSRLEQRNPHLLDPFSDNSGVPLGWITIVSLAAWGLGYFGQPHILARFKAIRSVRQLPLARRIAMSWVVLSLIAASLVGLVGVPSFDQPLADAERVFIELVGLLFHPLIAGICLAAILAAIMSTADSQLLVASSAFTEDLYRVLWRRQASERELVLVGRLAVVGIAAAAFLLALDPDSQVLDLVAYAWAGFGAAFGPVVVFSLYWSRMSRNGVLAGIIAGGVTVVLWKQLQGGIFDLYEIVPGILVATLAILLVSRLERPAGVE